jgi:hypothetical protein
MNAQTEKGQMMIRLVTYRNFPVLDVQIERAYRRRRLSRDVVFLDDVSAFSALRSFGNSRRSARSREWLRKLACAIDALDGKRTRLETAPSRLVRANAPRTAQASKRRRRLKRP